MKYYLEIKAQKSVGSNRYGFGGPDCYVAVQCVPDDQTALRVLNRRFAGDRIFKRYFVAPLPVAALWKPATGAAGAAARAAGGRHGGGALSHAMPTHVPQAVVAIGDCANLRPIFVQRHGRPSTCTSAASA